MSYIVIFGLSVVLGSLFHHFWWGVGTGLIIDLCLFLWHKHGAAFKAWRKERKVAKTALPGAPAPAKEKSPGLGKALGKVAKWVLGLGLVAFGIWYWHSAKTEEGVLGEYIAKENYEYPASIQITEKAFTQEGEQFCDPGLEPGRYRFRFYREDFLEKYYPKEAGFWTLDPKTGTTGNMSFIGRVRINHVLSSKTRVTIGEDHCFRVFIHASPGTVMLGNPIFINGRPVAHSAQSVSKPAITTVIFYVPS